MRRVALLLAILAASVVPGCRKPVLGNRTNVLLVTWETTRADHLGAYGYARDTSPSVDRFAEEGALFLRHNTVSPRTNPSLASLLTSTYPQEHGTRNILLPLEPENRTLAEILRDAGYETAAVQTHPRLVRTSGFEQGFATYDDDFQAHPLADAALEDVARRIESLARGSRPWFVWVHVMDPHWTYDPPAPWNTAFGPEDPRTSELYRDLAARRRTIGPVIFRNAMPPDEVRSFVDLYDGEIRFTDRAFGALLESLSRLGLDRKTLVVLTADHGESLGEHHYFFEHGDLGSEPEIHIPLVLRLPGKIPAGARIEATTSSVDVVPTILDLAGIRPEGQLRGASLVPLIDRTSSDDRPCFGETDRSLHEEAPPREIEGVRGKTRWVKLGRYKLVHTPRREPPAERHLFDVEADPLETTDVAGEHPEVFARLGALLSAWLAEDRMEERDYHVSPELRDTLRSLGYVN